MGDVSSHPEDFEILKQQKLSTEVTAKIGSGCRKGQAITLDEDQLKDFLMQCTDTTIDDGTRHEDLAIYVSVVSRAEKAIRIDKTLILSQQELHSCQVVLEQSSLYGRGGTLPTRKFRTWYLSYFGPHGNSLHKLDFYRNPEITVST
jgi:hypothetical protein